MPTSANDLHAAVAAAFSDRPTLRQIAGREALKLLAERLDAVKFAKLPDAAALVLQIPSTSTDYPSWTPRPLLDVLLAAVFQGRDLRMQGKQGGEFMLSVTAPMSFKDKLGNPLEHTVISVQQSMDALQDLVLLLPWHFRKAQVDYWNDSGSLGVSRDFWLQQQLKSSLLGNLPLQGLNSREQALVLGLLKDDLPASSVFAVQVEVAGEACARMLPQLLVHGEWDEDEVMLWCSPSGVVRRFDAWEAFASTLCQMQGGATLTWRRFALEGDVFAQQAALMLDGQLETLEGLRLREGDAIELGEIAYAAASNPARHFIPGYGVDPEASLVAPPGMGKTSAATRFAYQRGLFELALAQADAQGQASSADVLDLQAFARKRLREVLIEDHPVEANYYPDDLVLTLTSAIGVPGTGWGTVLKRTITLTEFAIGNLASLQGAVLQKVEHRDDQLIQPWLTADYLKALVERVDIGASYLEYVRQIKGDEQGKADREACFTREWRCSLLFSGLLARLDRCLSEAALECVVDFCRGQVNLETPGIQFMPLALQRTPGPDSADRVHGMYVLFAPELEVVLLYRPLYMQTPLLEYSSIKAMMVAIAKPGPLNDSVLDWMSEASRDGYSRGAFDALFLPEQAGVTLPVPVKVTFSADFWLPDIDTRLYQAHLDVLLELAARQSVSTAQSRWAVLLQGGWLLFDTFTLFMSGPVATVAWLVQGLSAVGDDMKTLLRGDAVERSAAVVDLLLNLADGLLHRFLPQGASENLESASASPWQAAHNDVRFSLTAPSVPVQAKVYIAGELPNQHARSIDFSYRGAQGLNVLGVQTRSRLRAMRSSVDLSGRSPEPSSSRLGLYQVDGEFYAMLAGEAYRVELEGEQVRVIAADGQLGPMLEHRFGAWRVDGAMHLVGGMPKSRLQQIKEANAAKLEVLNNRDKALVLDSVKLKHTFERHGAMLRDTAAELRDLEEIAQPSAGELQRRTLLAQLVGRYREVVVYDIKGLIDNALEHDKVLDDITALPHKNPVLHDAIKESREKLRKELIEDCESFYNQMAAMISDENLDALAAQIVVRPQSDDEVQLYRSFHTGLESVVKWQSDLVAVAQSFDRVLEITLKDASITLIGNSTGLGKHAWLKAIIEQRQRTGIDLEFQLLRDFAELSLDRTGVEVQEHVLQEYEDYLMGEALKSAGAAHSDVTRGDVSLDDQVGILSGVNEAYGEAHAMLDYLSSMGGLAVRPQWLRQYRALLESLMNKAEIALVGAVREEAQQLTRPIVQSVYAPRGGKRHVVKTQRGRSVVGIEREIDGEVVLEQLDDSDKVLKTFRQEGAGWLEKVTATEVPRRPSLVLAEERQQGKRLIGEVEAVIGLSRQYERNDEPLSMATVIAHHVDKLKDVRASIPRTDEDQALLEMLDNAIERLETVKRDKLVGLYLATSHPTATSLRYLLQEEEVTVSRQGARVRLADNDYLDIYEIVRKPKGGQKAGRPLWEAHFHYPRSDTPSREFSKGHLKLGYQSKLGREAQMRAAASGREVLAIYRGNVRLGDVEELIPFD